MEIAVFATEEQWLELMNNEPARLNRATKISDVTDNTDAVLILQEDLDFNFSGFSKPMFLNSVLTSLEEMKAPANLVRINGWPGFIDRKVWEVSGSLSQGATDVLTALGKTSKVVGDEVGFVSASVIAMIINEAFFSLEDGISTRPDIDTAMKLGTNYPFGPFEWCAKIGANNIYKLLNKLSTRDKRYLPSHLLAKEAVI